MNNEPSSDSEEEILVYAEFDQSIDIDKYRSIHVLGINEEIPIIQADNTFFTGKFKSQIGTYMFFEENPHPPCADSLFDKIPEKNLKYVLKTSKLLNMEHSYVIPRAGTATTRDQIVKSEEEPCEALKIKFGTVEEAINKFKTMLNLNSEIVRTVDSQTPMDCDNFETN